jgi:hypothetical protein
MDTTSWQRGREHEFAAVRHFVRTALIWLMAAWMLCAQHEAAAQQFSLRHYGLLHLHITGDRADETQRVPDLMTALIVLIVFIGIWRARKRRAQQREQERTDREHEALLIRATRDALTGLWNRPAILDILAREIESSRQRGRTGTLRRRGILVGRARREHATPVPAARTSAAHYL